MLRYLRKAPLSKKMFFADVKLTPTCSKRIQEISREIGEKVLLRLSVKGGGCSGFQYNFKIENKISDSDAFINVNQDSGLLVDINTAKYLRKCVIDYVSTLLGSSFEVVENAAATAECSCGNSFQIDDAEINTDNCCVKE